MNETLQNIRSRRSVRSYSDRQVPKQELEAVLEAASYAPSPGGTQPWHFSVIRNKQLINALSHDSKEVAKNDQQEFVRALANTKEFNAFHQAPAVIVVSGEEKNPLAPAACAAATQNILLAAESLGLAACWVNFGLLVFEGERSISYKEILEIPEGYKPLYAAALGYAKGEKPVAAPRKEHVVTFLE